ncbi:MAG: hypothetical protein EA362_02815 [Saprospirales bacterium]|nr:MAG: hypothetical protein EA362_02815 [Saprospirales bacterium]
MSHYSKILLFLYLWFFPLLLFGENYQSSNWVNTSIGDPVDADTVRSYPHERIINFGLEANLGGGYLRFPDSHLRTKGKFNMAFGAFGRVNITHKVAFQINALYDINNYKIEGGKLNRQSITLPATVQLFSAREDSPDFRPGIFGGVYYRRNFSLRDSNMPLPIEDFYSENERGFTFGVFIEDSGFRIGYSTFRALTDANRVGDSSRAVSNHFMIAYVF